MTEPVELQTGGKEKVSAALMNDLRSRILTGELSEGSRLPTERELCAESGLSRTSVRDAIHTLEVEGLVVTRSGRGGGSVVQRPKVTSVEKSIDYFIRGQAVNLASVIEVRRLFEPIVARLAAQRRTDEDLVVLGQAQARLEMTTGSPRKFLHANTGWHLAVVQASHNDLLIAFMSAIARSVFEGTIDEEFNNEKVRGLTLVAHDRIMKAIVEQDPDAAERRMRRHVEAYGKLAERARTA